MTGAGVAEAVTTARSINAICRDWKISMARCHLECTEAADHDEDGVAAACTRADARHDELFAELECGDWRPDPDEIAQLINLAILLIKEYGIPHRDWAIHMLAIARKGVFRLESQS